MKWRFALTVLLAGTAAHAAPVKKGPWVQKVTPSSAEVRVELDAPAPVSIEIGARTIESKEPRDFHVVKIDALDPATRYPFTLHAKGTSMPGAFTTAPKNDSAESFRFLIYGDNRTDDTGHEAVVRSMVPVKSDFVVHTGDYVEDGRRLSDWQKFFDIEAPLLRDRALFGVIGNHEMIDGQSQSYVKYLAAGDAPTVLDGTMRWGNTRFFFLNSMVQYKQGPDRAWLENVLRDADSEVGITWRIAVMHHSPWSSGPHGDNLYLKDAGVPELLRVHHVDLILAGHDHIYERGEENHLPYIVTGGGGAPTYKIKRPKASARKLESVRHFVLASVDKDKIAMEMIRVDGSIIEKCGLTKEGWDCDKGATPLPDSVIEPNDSITPSTDPPKKSKCGCDVPGLPTSTGPVALVIAIAAIATRRRMQRCAR